MQKPHYPEWLEQEWLQIARDLLGSEQPDTTYLEKQIGHLSNLFTYDRSVLSRRNYYQEPGFIAGYGLFFFPQIFVRSQITLRELLARGWIPPRDRPFRLLDFASGLGAAAFGALSVFAQKEIEVRAQVHAVDRAVEALKISSQLAERLRHRFIPFDWHTETVDISDPRRLAQLEGNRDLIIISYGLNELFQSAGVADVLRWLRAAMDLLTPQGILLILEPALQETSEMLEQVRDAILAGGRYFVRAPCLHRELCPLLKQGKYWCHEVRSWYPPQTVQRMNRHLYREIEVLKFSFLALSPSPPPELKRLTASQGANALRLISPVSLQKGRILFSGCAADGFVHQYDILSRHVTDRNYRLWERGDILTLNQTLQLTGGSLRIAAPEDVRQLKI